MRPRSLFLLGAASAAVVVIALASAGSGTCSQGGPPWPPEWVTVVSEIFGPLSILAIFGSIFTWSREHGSTRGWTGLNWFTQALVGACVWGGVGYVVTLLIVVDKSGCLS
ncbi:MAG TPA: hypothetical protein VJ838_02300 [Gaiellaceae bacterium]|nr:hypothetical protein [Gaiellaceae bacterium]